RLGLADRAARARAVLDHDGGADAVGQRGREDAREAVDRATRGQGNHGAHGLALPEGRLIHENGNEEQRKPESPHAASFVMSFAMREASLSFSRSSTASRS